MSGRSRTQLINPTGGYYDVLLDGSPYQHFDDGGATIVYRSICDDFVHDGAYDSDFSISRIDMRNRRPYNGSGDYHLGSHILKSVFTNYKSSSSFSQYGTIPLPTYPKTDGAYAAELIARTSPNRYDVNNLENLADLKDLPKLVKLAGDSILKKGAGAYLTWNFGWKPLLSDVRKMLDFQNRANKRAKEIHHLYEKGGLHRKRALDKMTTSSVETFNENVGYSLVNSFKIKQTMTSEKWGSIRWKPTTLPPRDDSVIRNQALRLVFGAELSPSSIWEALPWSWLVDWFSNTGDYLVAFNNIVPCSHSRVCIMTHSVSKREFQRTDSNSGIIGGDGYGLYETKKRSVVDATLTAGIPFLSRYQLSILGALFITRHRAR